MNSRQQRERKQGRKLYLFRGKKSFPVTGHKTFCTLIIHLPLLPLHKSTQSKVNTQCVWIACIYIFFIAAGELLETFRKIREGREWLDLPIFSLVNFLTFLWKKWRKETLPFAIIPAFFLEKLLMWLGGSSDFIDTAWMYIYVFSVLSSNKSCSCSDHVAIYPFLLPFPTVEKVKYVIIRSTCNNKEKISFFTLTLLLLRILYTQCWIIM